MNDLSPEARSLLTAARVGGVPTAARRHNIKHAVLLRAAAVTAVSAGASTVGATSVTAKLVLAGVLASVATGGAVGVWKLRAGHEASGTPSAPAARSLPVVGKTPSERPRAMNEGQEPASEPARASGRTPASKAPVREASHLTPTHAPSPAAQPSVEKGADKSADKSVDKSVDKRLSDEVVQLRRAHAALRDGKPALALRILADYDRAFPHGALTEERTAIAAIAACQEQPGPTARAQAQSFLRRAPSALLGERVRTACFPGEVVSPK